MKAASDSVSPPGRGAEELAYRLRQQCLLSDFSAYAHQNISPEELLQEATAICAEALHARFSKIMEYLPEQDRFLIKAGVGWDPGVLGQSICADLASPTGYAFKTGEPTISSHLEPGTRFRTPRVLAQHGIKRAINVRINSQDQPYGVLEVDADTASKFDTADLSFLQAMAGLLGIVIGKRQAESALRDSTERLHLASRATNDAIWDWDFTSGQVIWSEAIRKGFGHQVQDLKTTAQWWKNHVHPDDRERVVSTIHAVIDGSGDHWRMEYRFLRSDGTWADVFDRGHVLRDDTGRAHRMIGVMLDLSERRRAEKALRESEARFRHMADSAPALIWMTDETGQVIFANLHFEYMFGQQAGDMLGDGWKRVIHPADLLTYENLAATAFAQRQPFKAEVRVRDKSGSIRWLRCEVVPRLDDGQAFLGYTGCSIDVTDAKVAQEHQQLLINELNHRVKNTLATVQSIASQTLRNAAPDQVQADLEARLLALSRAHDVLTRENWEGANLQEIVVQAVAPYRGRAEERFHIAGPEEVRLAPRAALAIAMALQELATNAIKYGALSNPTGKVSVTWTAEPEGAGRRLRLIWRESGGPPVEEPRRRGFGTRLIERSLAQDLDGQVTISFERTGVVCAVEALIA